VELATPPKAAAVSRADHPQVPGSQDVGSSSPRQYCHWPRIETGDAWISVGIDRSLDVALDLVKRRAIEALPDRENGTYLVTVGRNADLNKAMDDASWDMINLLEKDKKLSRLDAYALASMVMDRRVAAPRGTEKAVNCLVPRSTWVTAR
jgi:acetamidase/formamidase